MMTGRFYFEVSSLPMLSLGEQPVVTVAGFDEFCRQRLPSELADALETVTLVPREEAVSEADRLWQVWETAVRNHLLRQRLADREQDAAKWLRHEADVFPEDLREVDTCLGQENPLLTQRALDELRWRKLDNLSVGREFTFDALVIYRLRLLLAWSWAAMADGPGQDARDKLVTHGFEQAMKLRASTHGSAQV